MRERPLALLVDDEMSFLEIASLKLQEGGFETVFTQEVREALRKAEELLPDVALSDIYMPPGPNGWEFALALRRNPKTKHIRIAFFTSLRDPWMEAQRDQETLRAELGDVIFLDKAGDVEVLAERLRAILAN